MGGGNGGEARETLTRDRICEAALEAIDEAGLESVSMRMLAASLGVKASSLYYHFQSKDELLDEVAEFLYRELGRSPGTAEWPEQVRRTFLQLRDLIRIHPNAVSLLVRSLASSPSVEERAVAMLNALERAGVDPARSACLVSNLVALLVGHSLLAHWVRQDGDPPRVGNGIGGRAAVCHAWVRDVVGAPMPESATPRAGSRRGSRVTYPDTSAFAEGLDALIAAFAPG